MSDFEIGRENVQQDVVTIASPEVSTARKRKHESIAAVTKAIVV